MAKIVGIENDEVSKSMFEVRGRACGMGGRGVRWGGGGWGRKE
jgi:hypothetical protein